MKVLWTFALVKRITVTAVVVCFYSFVLATFCQSVLEKGVSSGSIAVFVFLISAISTSRRCWYSING